MGTQRVTRLCSRDTFLMMTRLSSGQSHVKYMETFGRLLVHAEVAANSSMGLEILSSYWTVVVDNSKEKNEPAVLDVGDFVPLS